MNEIDPKKYTDIIIKNKKKEKKKENNYIRKYLTNLTIRVLIVAILFLSVLIVCNKSSILKDKIHKYLYTEDISFTKINKLYNKYLGGILPFKNKQDTEKVFNESLKYNSSSLYYDGVKLTVDDNYLVPSLDEGMVVFVGEKENYGNVIIIENLDGVNIWYGNIGNSSLKLYDYIEKGSFIGEADKELYLVFSKDDKYLDYEEYLS